MTVSIALIAFLMSMMVNFFSAVGIRVSVELLAVGMPVVVAMGFALLSVIVVFVVVRMTVRIALLMSMMVNFFSAVGIRVSVELLAVGMPVVVAMGNGSGISDGQKAKKDANCKSDHFILKRWIS